MKVDSPVSYKWEFHSRMGVRAVYKILSNKHAEAWTK